MLWPIVAQVADRLDGPRTALVAEAAHVVPPIGAQGLNMSLADIATLLDLCAEARATARHRRAGAARAATTGRGTARCWLRIAGIDALNRAAMAGARPLRDLRRAGLKALARDAAAPAGGDAARARGGKSRGPNCIPEDAGG